MTADVSVSGIGNSSPDMVSLILLSGEFERVHYGLVLASAAAAIGKSATLFFTNRALQALRAVGPDGAPGWRSLVGSEGSTGGAVDDEFRARGVAGFDELLSACIDLGVRFIACEMGLRTMGMPASELRADAPIEIAGAVTLLADASAKGAMLVF
jgi:peroxiredoxin family protein